MNNAFTNVIMTLIISSSIGILLVLCYITIKLKRRFNAKIIFNKNSRVLKADDSIVTLEDLWNSDAYQAVIAAGKPVVPYVLRELQRENNHWFIALEILTRTNPVPKRHYGNIRQMRFYWLLWGKRNRYRLDPNDWEKDNYKHHYEKEYLEFRGNLNG